MGLHERGNILGFEELECPKKLILTGAKDAFEAHDMFDKIEVHEKSLKPFYDHYLKGVDNGYPSKTPDVQLFMRGSDKWLEEPVWPVKRASFQSWYLRKGPTGSVTSLNDGRLSLAPPDAEEGATSYSYPDPKWHFGVAALGPHGPDPVARNITFTSEALIQEVEIAGCIVLELFVASTNIDTDFFIKLSDQFPQSTEDRGKGLQPNFMNIAKGWLRASHREKDEKRSTPRRPYYTHTNPQPIEPGRIYKYEIEIWPAVHCFRKGNRIRLDISIGDTLFTDSFFTHQYFYYKVGTDTYHHNVEHASRLLLPVLAS